ncbi:MAG: hypothetical protein KDK33_03995, partial [Leptospiraceae bacterium]|nr:hypothetical protein [Leptospiraceae bacterium]
MSQSEFDAFLWKELQARQEKMRSNLAPLLKDRENAASRPTLNRRATSTVSPPSVSTEADKTDADALPAIRGKIFSEEFQAVKDQVMAHDSNDPIPSLGSLSGNPPSDPLFQYTVGLHSLPVIEAEHFQYLLQTIADELKAEALAIEPLDSMGNSFRPALHLNLDDTTVDNLHFAVRDRYIEPSGWIHLRLSEYAEKDPFLRKRFSKESLERFHWMSIYHDGRTPYPMLLVLLFESRERPQVEDQTMRDLERFLGYVRPLVFDMAHTYSFAEDRRILQKAFRTTRRFLRRAHPQTRWLVEIDGVREHPGRQAFFDRLQE